MRWLLIASLAILRAAYGDDPIRPRSPGHLAPETYAIDETQVLEGSIAIGFQPKQLFRDFPELQTYFEKNPQELPGYLARTFGAVGTEQRKLSGIRNTDIPQGTAAKVLTRNAAAGNLEAGDMRAGFVEVVHPKTGQRLGFAGVKGNGFKTSLGYEPVHDQVVQWEKLAKRQAEERQQARPDERTALAERHRREIDAIRTKDHSTGLVTVAEAYAEMAKQRALQAAFDAHNARYGTNFQTNEVYGIVVLPFHVLGVAGPDGKPELQRAAVIVRQAEFRGPNLAAMRMGVPKDLMNDRYGFSQATVSGALIDFGGVLSAHPTLQSVFAIDDPVQRKASNAQYARAFSRGAELGRHIDWILRDGKKDVHDKEVRDVVEGELAKMLEPIMKERAEVLAAPGAKKPAVDPYAEAVGGLLSSHPTEAQLVAAVRFATTDYKGYVDELARRRDRENPAPGYEGYGDRTLVRSSFPGENDKEANLRTSALQDAEEKRKVVSHLLVGSFRNLETFRKLIVHKDLGVRVFALELLPDAHFQDADVQRQLSAALRAPVAHDEDRSLFLQFLNDRAIPIDRELRGPMLEAVLTDFAKEGARNDTIYIVDARMFLTTASPNDAFKAIVNAWKKEPRLRKEGSEIFFKVVQGATAILGTELRAKLAEELGLAQYLLDHPTMPEGRKLFEALDPGHPALVRFYLAALRKNGPRPDALAGLERSLPLLRSSRRETADLRAEITETLERLIPKDSADHSFFTDRAKALLDEYKRSPLMTKFVKCVSRLSPFGR